MIEFFYSKACTTYRIKEKQNNSKWHRHHIWCVETVLWKMSVNRSTFIIKLFSWRSVECCLCEKYIRIALTVKQPTICGARIIIFNIAYRKLCVVWINVHRQRQWRRQWRRLFSIYQIGIAPNNLSVSHLYFFFFFQMKNIHILEYNNNFGGISVAAGSFSFILMALQH